MSKRKKLLFVVEALTFAHVARSALLAQLLRGVGYEVHFAYYPDKYMNLVDRELTGVNQWSLKHCVSYSDYIARMNAGVSPYDMALLSRYIEEERDLFAEIEPDLVIGDLRYSLSISCFQHGVYYVNLVNAVWSPFVKQELIFPEGCFPAAFGLATRNVLFQLLRPFAFTNICRPFNILRLKAGLPAFRDIFELHCAGDANLYLDPPELFDVPFLPDNHRFIGPVLHSLEGPTPSSMDSLEPSLPVIFVSLGSSGSADRLPLILKNLEQLPVSLAVATSARVEISSDNARTIIYDFLPAREILRRSSLVICNGGSPLSYLALSEGVPVLAVCSNMDQHLVAQTVTKFGVGLSLRAEYLNRKDLLISVGNLLGTATYKERAESLSKNISSEKTFRNFQSAIESSLSCSANQHSWDKCDSVRTPREEQYGY
jgi:UDP:flavonoid glycosyltransferase YjiC (YdhE family)